MIAMPEDSRRVEIPIQKQHMQEWSRSSDAKIQFSFNLQFGVLSNVTRVNMKRPILIISRSSPPRCSEFTCCLSSNRHAIQESNVVYHNLLMPKTMRNQKCIECSRVSEMPEQRMDVFNLIIHSQMGVDDVKEPSQLGRCRATSWSSLPTTFVVGNGNDEHAVVKSIPYFNAEGCECVEEEVPLDYEAEQERIDAAAIRKTIQEARLKTNTQRP
ncbi:hypothetical protein PENTCL1PPCAC_4197 [Pristionchus entomophagus]|uniref:Uncharacterized protein n=1 Tax=Pristionchus entomophagus TaxID=358040 RepID=A0AAV5SH89_9BILA|nr:hypothetical protein PENTCL1PPCAC_4197 [Pristionchus entomophagus]